MNELATIASVGRSFCTFRIARRLHGIDVLYVREISLPLAMTPVPQAPAAVRGLVNLRSRIYLVLDLRPLLAMASVPCTESSRLVILKPEIGQDIGLLVEEGGDIVHLRTDLIDTSAGAGDSSRERATSLVVGVGKLESELMILVDPRQIVESIASLFDEAPRLNRENQETLT